MNGTGLVPPGPTLATILTAIGASRIARTAAENTILGNAASGQPFSKAALLAVKQANNDTNTQLDLLIANLGL